MVTTAETISGLDFKVAGEDKPDSKPIPEIQEIENKRVSEILDMAETLPWDIYSAFGEETAKKVLGDDKDDKELLISKEGVTYTNQGAMIIPESVNLRRAIFLIQQGKYYVEHTPDAFLKIELGMPIKDADSWREGAGVDEEQLPPEMAVGNIQQDTFRSQSQAIKNPNVLRGPRIADLLRQGYEREVIDKMSDEELAVKSSVGKGIPEGIPNQTTGVRLFSEFSETSAKSMIEQEPGIRLEATLASTPKDEVLIESLGDGYAQVLEEAAPALKTYLHQEGVINDGFVRKDEKYGTYLHSILFYEISNYEGRPTYDENYRPIIIAEDFVVLEDKELAYEGTVLFLKKGDDQKWRCHRFEIHKNTEQMDTWMKSN